MKINAKGFVKTIYPKASAELKTVNDKCYWLIDSKKEYCYIAYGETQTEAWENAKSRIIKKIYETKHY